MLTPVLGCVTDNLVLGYISCSPGVCSRPFVIGYAVGVPGQHLHVSSDVCRMKRKYEIRDMTL